VLRGRQPRRGPGDELTPAPPQHPSHRTDRFPDPHCQVDTLAGWDLPDSHQNGGRRKRSCASAPVAIATRPAAARAPGPAPFPAAGSPLPLTHRECEACGPGSGVKRTDVT